MNFLKSAGVILSLLFSYTAYAQQVEKKDTLAGTALTMSMDQKLIYDMEKIENFCGRVAVNTPSGPGAATPRPKVFVPDRALTNAEVCRNNPRILGYKIQLAVVKSNAEANEVKAFFRRRFPSLKVETDASLRPNYKILAGSYFNKQSAASDLSAIRKEFKAATPVQYRIFCAEAK